MITTTQNKQIKQIIKLKKSARERRKQELFLVEGIRMFTEIPEEYLYKVYASEDFYNEHRVIFEHMDVELVSPQVMKEISDTMTPQGVLALVKMMKYSLEDLLEQEKPLFLVLENLQDPGNLGTILRTGEGAGINGVIMSHDTVDIYNPKVTRSTMGSIFRVPFVYVDDLLEVAETMKQKNIITYAAHLNGTDYTKEDYQKGTAFFIGNEGNGLTDATAGQADCLIRIPMKGQLESLNAGVAAAILMYKTKFGIYVRVVGENEDSAISLGLKTQKYKYIAVLIGAFCCALAGINLSMERMAMFTSDMTAGRGFIAIAAIYCGQGKPVQSSLYAILFGVARSLAVNLSVYAGPAAGMFDTIPYIIMVAVLAVVSFMKFKDVKVRGYKFD